jgi:hypothetical protein
MIMSATPLQYTAWLMTKKKIGEGREEKEKLMLLLILT